MRRRREEWREGLERAERVTDEWVKSEQEKELKAKMVRTKNCVRKFAVQ